MEKRARTKLFIRRTGVL